MSEDLVWYAAYGSNLHRARLDCYLQGGRPHGSSLWHPGCRDPRPPRRHVPLLLPGRMYFAMESAAWGGGGMAFLDPDGPGSAAGRGYLLTVDQFLDVAAQEMRRPPGETPLDLAAALRDGRAVCGLGRYETLVLAGERDGWPVLTFTAPWAAGDVPWTRPSAAYLTQLGAGLLEAHGWTPERIADYLCSRPGAAGNWSREAVRALLPEAADASRAGPGVPGAPLTPDTAGAPGGPGGPGGPGAPGGPSASGAATAPAPAARPARP
ncbi:hypothetical protein [Phaeacidiphilus oryzae]|uniref:hypothetical protein n=1 Tax=Phaeacidiphilus oryzae TaxID=348818 RepID=UPI0007C689FD|nr:hypothetical protein [Phaeacidiphilus oryzae]